MGEGAKHYKAGDKVRHAGRPEWGLGVVSRAVSITHEGKPAHRLTIGFEHAGHKTINTAFAKIVAADDPAANAPTGFFVPKPPPPEPPSLQELAALPEATSDKLSSIAHHLRATLELYRFPDTPRGLVDWAVARSQLTDPIGHYGRHELDNAFERFRYERDKHLRSLVAQLERDRRVDILRDAVARLDDTCKSGMRQALQAGRGQR